ncbi:MAG: SEC-C domain-containing protein [Patescibacteria group bacterium]|nr:SEC-C domain-containing protein [Patescibacteria group bacterium]MDE1946113.1 SEC-C domain-containing protein [Patescibacteria group bacterium]
MFLEKLFGSRHEKIVKSLQPIVQAIGSFEADFGKLSDGELKGKTGEFRARIAAGETLDDLLPEAFAAVREAAKRTLKERHFDVQMIGGIILHRGNIAEMKTGEGKTLVATLPAYLNALSGDGVHVVTVNDYLSRRDSVWMGQIYNALGLSVGVLNHEASYLYDPEHMPKAEEAELDAERDKLGAFKVVHEFLRPVTRREAYAADITYGTNSEFGFDYLRDNIEYDTAKLRQRDFNFAIVDEVDSILIDEARTPLIISAPVAESESLYGTFTDIVRNFVRDADFTVDEKRKAIELTDAGITKAEQALKIDNIYTQGGIKLVHHLQTAIRAKALFERDKDYVVKDGEIVIVDEFTGRLQPGRRWSEGLHQAIESKEGVKVQKESRTFASVTYQNYFRMYKKLAGMTGTAMTSSEEFFKVYHMDVIPVPTNVPVARKDYNDLIFQTEQGKFRALARMVKERHAAGQPVLIGTVSIEKNEVLSAFLKREGVPHAVLNAKNHEREGEITAGAGTAGAVTIATNMAGRGVDIKLGGVPFNKEEYEKVKKLGGLAVFGTERHDARRIDNQLRGRSGRQGDPGETRFFVSLEDTLMRIFASDMVKRMMHRFGIPEDEPIENGIITRSLESAQTKIEGFNFDARKQVLEYDDVLNFQRKTIYERRRALLVGGMGVVKEKLAEIAADDASQKIISEKIAALGEEEFYRIVRIAMLQAIDMLWVDHLEAMDYLRGSVNLRAYGQRDPLVEYKKEGLQMFKTMEGATNVQVLSILPHIGAGAMQQEEKQMQETQRHMKEAGGEGKADAAPAQKKEKIGRNDPCPCGSGKKYKNCHGK